MMVNPTCPIHGETQCKADGQTCTCLRITLITSDGTTISPVQTEGFGKFLKNMRDWNVTLYGRIDGQKEPVPDAFQSAFKDGELEP